MNRVAVMDKEETQKPSLETTEEFQRFEDVASKIFQVPIDEVRELEKKEKQNKSNKT
jgi:hypothetical protein